VRLEVLPAAVVVDLGEGVEVAQDVLKGHHEYST
jgi:hypothetical protein